MNCTDNCWTLRAEQQMPITEQPFEFTWRCLKLPNPGVKRHRYPLTFELLHCALMDGKQTLWISSIDLYVQIALTPL